MGSAGALALAGCQSTSGGNGNGNGSGNGNGNDTGTGNDPGTESEELSGTIDIAGSSTVFPLAVAMRGEFLNAPGEAHPDVSINISSTGTGGGFQNRFCPGQTDFNNASRPITESEKQLCSDNGVTPVELKVATDALTVVVNNDADWIDCITVDELAQIWSADEKPAQWSDVNSDWPDEELKLFGPTDASGTFDYFHEAVVGEDNEMRYDYQATERDQQIMQGVQNDEYAMGYLGFAYYSGSKDQVKALGIDNGDGCVEPSLETAKNGKYKPLSRPLFSYVAKESLTDTTVAEFARFFVEKSTSQKIVADQVGYVPNTDGTQTEMMDKLETAIEEANA